jgi:hemoglobin
MKKDIEDISDIKCFVNCFYEKVRKDRQIGYLFNEVAKVNWEKHLPIMYSFWQQIIFSNGDFKGNPMLAHQRLNEKSTLTKDHFERWIMLFRETIDELFEGFVAEQTKNRARDIAMVMKFKIIDGSISRPSA